MASNELDKAIQNLIAMPNKKIEITKVWENASPTSQFVAQSVSIGTVSPNDFVMIKAKYAPTETRTITTLCKIGSRGEIVRLSSSWATTFSTREFSVTGTQVQFEAGRVVVFNGTISTDNKVVVPTEIYVIKGVD